MADAIYQIKDEVILGETATGAKKMNATTEESRNRQHRSRRSSLGDRGCVHRKPRTASRRSSTGCDPSEMDRWSASQRDHSVSCAQATAGQAEYPSPRRRSQARSATSSSHCSKKISTSSSTVNSGSDDDRYAVSQIQRCKSTGTNELKKFRQGKENGDILDLSSPQWKRELLAEVLASKSEHNSKPEKNETRCDLFAQFDVSFSQGDFGGADKVGDTEDDSSIELEHLSFSDMKVRSKKSPSLHRSADGMDLFSETRRSTRNGGQSRKGDDLPEASRQKFHNSCDLTLFASPGKRSQIKVGSGSLVMEASPPRTSRAKNKPIYSPTTDAGFIMSEKIKTKYQNESTKKVASLTPDDINEFNNNSFSVSSNGDDTADLFNTNSNQMGSNKKIIPELLTPASNMSLERNLIRSPGRTLLDFMPCLDEKGWEPADNEFGFEIISPVKRINLSNANTCSRRISSQSGADGRYGDFNKVDGGESRSFSGKEGIARGPVGAYAKDEMKYSSPRRTISSSGELGKLMTRKKDSPSNFRSDATVMTSKSGTSFASTDSRATKLMVKEIRRGRRRNKMDDDNLKLPSGNKIDGSEVDPPKGRLTRRRSGDVEYLRRRVVNKAEESKFFSPPSTPKGGIDVTDEVKGVIRSVRRQCSAGNLRRDKS